MPPAGYASAEEQTVAAGGRQRETAVLQHDSQMATLAPWSDYVPPYLERSHW